MKWPTILIGSILAVGFAVALIVITLGKGSHQPVARVQNSSTTTVEPRAIPSLPTPQVTDPAPLPRIPPATTSQRLLDHPQALTGTLRTVDVSGILGYLPVGSNVSGPAPVTPKQLLAGPATQITLDGKPSDIAALRPGMDIAFLDSGDKPLEKLEAFLLIPDGKEHVKQGPIDKIEPNLLTILAGRSTLFPVKLNYSTDIPTTIDGKPATAADLRYRMLAAVTFIGNDARSIAASTVLMDGAAHHADGTLVAAANADGFAIRVYGNPGFDVKLKTDPNFKVLRETSRGTNPTTEDAAIADLQPGLPVVATYVNGSASDITIKFGRGAGPARGTGRGGRGTPPTTTPATRTDLP